MSDRILCPDTSVLIKYLTPDEQEPAAVSLIRTALADGSRLVAPAWVWAEVGSVLRKKVRASLLRPDEAEQLFAAFLRLPINYLDTPALRSRAWELADTFALPTLYEAAFLACTEVAQGARSAEREFWTADQELLRQLGAKRPAYVRQL